MEETAVRTLEGDVVVVEGDVTEVLFGEEVFVVEAEETSDVRNRDTVGGEDEGDEEAVGGEDEGDEEAVGGEDEEE